MINKKKLKLLLICLQLSSTTYYQFLAISKKEIIESLYIPTSINTNNSGYNNCNMLTNGELEIIKKLIQANDIVFDVGANKGEWSSHVFALAPKSVIYAFEPMPETFNILQHNLNKYPAQVHNLAFSDDNNCTTFYCYEEDQLNSFYNREILKIKHNMNPKSTNVLCVTLDYFCQKHNIEKIDFLKIDTEGAELRVLRGAKTMLEKNGIQVLQFEYGGTYKDAKITLYEVYKLLTGYGYKVAQITPLGLIAIDNWQESLENYLYANYIAYATFQEYK